MSRRAAHELRKHLGTRGVTGIIGHSGNTRGHQIGIAKEGLQECVPSRDIRGGQNGKAFEVP